MNKIKRTSDTLIIRKEPIREPVNPRKRAKEGTINDVEKSSLEKTPPSFLNKVDYEGDTSNTGNLVVAEEANLDEAITEDANNINEMENDLKDEQNAKSYKDKIKIDIENINTIERINKVYTKQWRTI